MGKRHLGCEDLSSHDEVDQDYVVSGQHIPKIVGTRLKTNVPPIPIRREPFGFINNSGHLIESDYHLIVSITSKSIKKK
jgi:hypothetical protein